MDWYKTKGTAIVQTMILNIYLPVITEIGFAFQRIIMRFLDRCCSKNGTRCTTPQQYINLYSGPEFLIHFRYSQTLNIIYVTMMYGPSLPILFPIAFLSFLITYFLEIFMLFYVYRVPITYDETLHVSVL